MLLGMLCLVLSSLNWRHSKRRCLMEILDPQVMHGSGSVLSMRCLWVCQECPILKRVRIISCCLVMFDGLIHLSVVGLISLNLLSLSKCHSLRHKFDMIFLASLLRSFLESKLNISMVWSLVACFAIMSALSFPSIPVWLVIHVSIVEKINNIIGNFVIFWGVFDT